MAVDLKKLANPKVLIIGGVAIIGGLFLASRLRPKASAEPSPEVLATPVLQPYAVDRNPDEYRAPEPVSTQPGASSGGSQTTPTKPGAPPVPPAGPKPAPQPAPGAGIPPAQPVPGTPRRDPTPPPRTTPPVTPNVPGGYPADCRGVQPRPHDHPGSQIIGLINAKGGNTRARAYALEWVFLGIANSGATGLSRFTNWIAQPAVWPRVNSTRRSRGLKAYTDEEFRLAVNDLGKLNQVTGGHDDRLSNDQLQTLWQRWHVPYLCA